MKHFLPILICFVISIGLHTSAIAKKHHKKVDTTSVTSSTTISTSPTHSESSNGGDGGTFLGMSILGFIFLLWILPSIVPAIIASAKGRSGLGIFLLSVFFTPLIGLIVALLMQSAKKPQQVIVTNPEV
jgi:hypothetical protein